MMRAQDHTPMETRAEFCPWQDLPEMAQSVPAELAGAEAGLGVLAIWHLFAANEAAKASEVSRAVVRCRVALDIMARRSAVSERLRGAVQ